MWPFNKKTTIADGKILAGAIDHHSHILPAVDDGVQTMEDAISTLGLYEKSGIKELWLTPHVMEDFPNSIEGLQKRFDELQKAYKGSITLHLASEYMMDNLFDSLLEQGEILPIGSGGNHLLVETSYFTPPMRLKEILQRIKSKGLHPLLAHPERYIYMDTNYFRELQTLGVKFQLNLLSLAGVYGRAAQKNAFWLLRNDMYTVAGSDLHCADALNVINNITLDKATSKRVCALLKEKL